MQGKESRDKDWCVGGMEGDDDRRAQDERWIKFLIGMSVFLSGVNERIIMKR